MVFHSMENFFAIFPRYGKIFSTLWKNRPVFSTQWKNFQRFFHTMEKLLPFFPHNGKSFRDFSTQWKNFFHGVENLVLGLFSGVLGLFSGAVERSTRRPLSTVERDRPRGREKRRPPQAVSALSRSRLGCGVGRGRFLAARSGVLRALRRNGGAACAARIYSGGC